MWLEHRLWALLQLHLHSRLTPGFNGLGRDNSKTRRELFKFCDLVGLIWEILRYVCQFGARTCIILLTNKDLLHQLQNEAIEERWHPRASCQIREIEGCACARNPAYAFPATAGYRAWHASRHVCGARAVMHAGIDNKRFPLKSVAGKPFPAFPVHAQTVILRIWEEAHDFMLDVVTDLWTYFDLLAHNYYLVNQAKQREV